MGSGLVDGGQREIGESSVVGPLGIDAARLAGDVGEVRELLECAVELGITLLDTADVHATVGDADRLGAAESLLGRALHSLPSLRDRFAIATKGGIVPGVPYDSSTHHLRAACEASLRRLGVDRLDLYQIHRPDPLTHPGEVADALVTLHQEGKIAEIGVTNHSPAQLSALQAHLPLEIATIGPEYSVLTLGPLFDGTFDQALELGLAPLVSGALLGGRIASGEGVPGEVLAVLDAIAEREGVSRQAIAVAFVLAHPSSPVALLDVRRAADLRSLHAALDVTLDRRDVYALIAASQGKKLR